MSLYMGEWMLTKKFHCFRFWRLCALDLSLATAKVLILKNCGHTWISHWDDVPANIFTNCNISGVLRAYLMKKKMCYLLAAQKIVSMWLNFRGAMSTFLSTKLYTLFAFLFCFQSKISTKKESFLTNFKVIDFQQNHLLWQFLWSA